MPTGITPSPPIGHRTSLDNRSVSGAGWNPWTSRSRADTADRPGSHRRRGRFLAYSGPTPWKASPPASTPNVTSSSTWRSPWPRTAAATSFAKPATASMAPEPAAASVAGPASSTPTNAASSSPATPTANPSAPSPAPPASPSAPSTPCSNSTATPTADHHQAPALPTHQRLRVCIAPSARTPAAPLQPRAGLVSDVSPRRPCPPSKEQSAR
jgi:hypothetical protein